MPKKKFDLFEVSSVLAAKLRTGTAEIMSAEVLDPNLYSFARSRAQGIARTPPESQLSDIKFAQLDVAEVDSEEVFTNIDPGYSENRSEEADD